MTPLTSEAIDIVRELRGIVDVSARLRFCARLLTGEHPTSLETRTEVARHVLLQLVGEIDAARTRLATTTAPVRLLNLLEEIGTLASQGAPFVRGNRLARIYYAAREARRVLRATT